MAQRISTVAKMCYPSDGLVGNVTKNDPKNTLQQNVPRHEKHTAMSQEGSPLYSRNMHTE